MVKKFLLVSIALLAIVVGVAGMSAFEAHIINVTAHIEEGINVSPTPISFGTVFPQEFLTKDYDIALSDSFLNNPDVDNIKYVIEQRLKPCPLKSDGTPEDPTCVPDTASETPDNPTGWHFLSLCPFLSKINTEADGTSAQNDISHPSYYTDNPPSGPSENDTCQTSSTQAVGILSKSATDTLDTWIIDLKVPPIQGFVGQDWPDSCVASAFIVNTNEATYGCDLWVKTTEVNSAPGI